MKVSLDTNIVSVIEGIVNHGHKAVIQRSGSGVIVMEERRQIKARTDSPKEP